MFRMFRPCSDCYLHTHMVLVWWIRHPQFCLRYFRKVIIINILRMTILVILLTRCVNNFCPTPKASESSCCPKVSMSILRMSTVGGVLGAIWATSAPGPSQHRTQLRGAGPCHDRRYHVFIQPATKRLTSQSGHRIIK